MWLLINSVTSWWIRECQPGAPALRYWRNRFYSGGPGALLVFVLIVSGVIAASPEPSRLFGGFVLFVALRGPRLCFLWGAQKRRMWSRSTSSEGARSWMYRRALVAVVLALAAAAVLRSPSGCAELPGKASVVPLRNAGATVRGRDAAGGGWATFGSHTEIAGKATAVLMRDAGVVVGWTKPKPPRGHRHPVDEARNAKNLDRKFGSGTCLVEPRLGGGFVYWWDHLVMRWFRLSPEGGDAKQGSKAQDDGTLGNDLRRLGRLAKDEWFTLSLGFTFLLMAAACRALIPQAVANTLVVALGAASSGTASGAAAAAATTAAAGVVADVPHKQALLQASTRLGQLAVAYGLLSGLRGLSMSVAENKLLKNLRKRTFARMLQQDIAFHDERSVGELTSRLNSDCEAVSSGLSLNLNIFLRNGVQLIFSMCYLAFTSWRLSLTLVSVWFVLFYVYSVYGRFTRRASILRQDALAGLNNVATEALQNVRTIRSFGSEDSMIDTYTDASGRLIYIEHQRAACYGLYAMFYNGLTEGIKAVALGAGGIMLARGAMSGQQLTAAMFHVEQVVGSSLAVGGQYRQLMQSVGSSRRVFQYYEMPPSSSVVFSPATSGDPNMDGPDTEEAVSQESRAPLETQQPPRQGSRIEAENLVGAFEFRNVSFSYPTRPADKILNGLNLAITPGKVTAIVGTSGSGKSTVAALLQRWYQPDEGAIHLDGVALQDLDPHWLRGRFGTVSQEPALFSTSVRENILLGIIGADPVLPPNCSDAELAEEQERLMIEAAKAAHAHEFIEELPQGYDTEVGNARMSGGQRQRLALARALVRRPRILILDEATSALDRKTEIMVQESINEYLRQTSATCVVIAHRLSTIRDADQIVVLDQGQVAEQGTHEELLGLRGAYYRLVRGAAG